MRLYEVWLKNRQRFYMLILDEYTRSPLRTNDTKAAVLDGTAKWYSGAKPYLKFPSWKAAARSLTRVGEAVSRVQSAYPIYQQDGSLVSLESHPLTVSEVSPLTSLTP